MHTVWLEEVAEYRDTRPKGNLEPEYMGFELFPMGNRNYGRSVVLVEEVITVLGLLYLFFTTTGQTVVPTAECTLASLSRNMIY